jgi:hypothetical protein
MSYIPSIRHGPHRKPKNMGGTDTKTARCIVLTKMGDTEKDGHKMMLKHGRIDRHTGR